MPDEKYFVEQVVKILSGELPMGKKSVSIEMKQTNTDPVLVHAESPFDDFDSDGDVLVRRPAEGSVSVAVGNFMWLGIKVGCEIEIRCRKDQFRDASKTVIAAAVAEVSDDAEWVGPMWREKAENIKAALEARWKKG